MNDLLRSHPEEKTVHYDLGVNYQLSGNQEQAAKHFLKFKETATYWEKAYPEDPESYITLGVVLTRLGEKSSGWKTGKRAIEMDSSLHFRFAQLLAVQERNSEALDHLEKALESGYRNLTWIKLQPDLQALQGDAGFQTLIRKYFGPQ